MVMELIEVVVRHAHRGVTKVFFFFPTLTFRRANVLKQPYHASAETKQHVLQHANNFSWAKACAAEAKDLMEQGFDFEAMAKQDVPQIMGTIRLVLPAMPSAKAANLANYIRDQFASKDRLSAAAPSAPSVDFRQRFVELLSKAQIHPRPEVLQRLQFIQPLAFSLAATVEEAKQWYEYVKSIPQTTTRGRFHALTGYQLDGAPPNLGPGFLYAYNQEGQPFLFKLILSQEFPEAKAAATLYGGPSIVPAKWQTAHDDDAERNISGLLMPKYERTLHDIGVQLPLDVLHSRLRDMITAINFIHAKNLVHMDLKDSNIFSDWQGKWWVGDFGSCVPFGSPILSTTPGCYPQPVKELIGTPAAWKYDWYMLCVIFARQVNCGVPINVDDLDADVRARLAAVDQPGLRDLLLRLIDFTGQTFEI